MDAWTENQLKLMSIGGNRQLKDYYQRFELNEVNVMERYNTNAAQHYRLRLRHASDGLAFKDPTPDFESGRQ